MSALVCTAQTRNRRRALVAVQVGVMLPVLLGMPGEASATAVAVFDDRVASVATQVPGSGILPFTIHENAFASALAAGGDSYGYDKGSDAVFRSPDGIRIDPEAPPPAVWWGGSCSPVSPYTPGPVTPA